MHDKKYHVASERNVGLSFETNNAIAQMMEHGIMTGNMTTDGMMMKPGQDITS